MYLINYKSTLLKIQHQFCFALDFNTIMLTLIVHENRANCKSIRCIEKIFTFVVVTFSLLNSADYRGTEGHLKILILFLKIINITVDACKIVDLTLVKRLNRRLCNRRINAFAVVDSTLAQTSNWRLHSRRFEARFQTLICMPFWTWMYFKFSYLTSYLDVSYSNFRCPDKFFQMIRKSCKTIVLKSSNWWLEKC